MWRLVTVLCQFSLWFSDGNPINDTRGVTAGNVSTSSRLIVDTLGFLDLTNVQMPNANITWLDANGASLQPLEASDFMELSLQIEGDGHFTLSLVNFTTSQSNDTLFLSASGKLKPLPVVSSEDVDYIARKIQDKYIPYQNIPDAPGKTTEEITKLGQMFFPFSPHSFELAMSLYDWTTASFTRLVFLKIFEYTNLTKSPSDEEMFPIDEPSIAEEIWESNWSSYVPQNPDYMRSFLMKPASSLQDVKTQLSAVATELHRFSNVQNRLLSAAVQSLPRSPILAEKTRTLYSGQVDIYQLGLEHFGIEFLECPRNSGPVNQPLVEPFATAMSSYVSPGKTITTKMVWSVTDDMKDAMHYSNGILLVAVPPDGPLVWETAAYITPLSDDPNKTEYIFLPGTRFEVKWVDRVTVKFNNQGEAVDTEVTVICLQPQSAGSDITQEAHPGAAEKGRSVVNMSDTLAPQVDFDKGAIAFSSEEVGETIPVDAMKQGSVMKSLTELFGAESTLKVEELPAVRVRKPRP